MSDSTLLLAGRTAVVTGSSTGIGRAIAVALAERGANLVLHGRSGSRALDQTRATIQSHDVSADCLFADFNDSFVADEFVDRAWQLNGGVDIWINNAGGDVLTGTNQEMPIEAKLDYLLQVDVKATLLLSRSIGQRMRDACRITKSPAGNSTIINIGWDQAWQGMEGESGEVFAATKGAIMAMSKSLAQSLAPEVRVNCVAPGWIKTAWGEQASNEWSQRAVAESLMGRWGEPQDVAEVVAFLASPSASFISGQIIPVNGGFRFPNSK